jgi:hypothetical protein
VLHGKGFCKVVHAVAIPTNSGGGSHGLKRGMHRRPELVRRNGHRNPHSFRPDGRFFLVFRIVPHNE